MKISRRRFVQGCCAGIAAMNGARLSRLAFAQGGTPGQRDIIVSVFLRGGMDALNFVAPYGDPLYQIARPDLGLRGGAEVIDLNGYLGLHPAAQQLKELLDAGHLAVIPAAGSPAATRSHFEAQDNAEYGLTDESYFDGRGWLARYLSLFQSAGIFSGVAVGSSLTRALQGFPEAISLSSADGFTLRGSSSQTGDIRRALRQIYTDANDPLATVGQTTLDAVDLVDLADPDNYVPGNGVTYPTDSEGRTFEALAQIIRLDLGLQAATIDIGGWDTHENQANSSRLTGTYADNVQSLSAAIHAFWSDLSDYHNRLTLVVMSEFGRRLRENNNRGTDHGHGGVMLVLSGRLAAGGIYGQWPGLDFANLFEGTDLEVTTDWRAVYSEILVARCGVTLQQLNEIFPYFQLGRTVGIFGLPSLNSSRQIAEYIVGRAPYDPALDMNGDSAIDITDAINAVNTSR